MAKMRVYELAKELKIDSKELVTKLIDMGMDVRNHMSVISEDEAQDYREAQAKSRSEVVEEKRITKKVIRRRRKKIKKPQAEAEAEAQAEAEDKPSAAAEPEPKAEEEPVAAAAEPVADKEPEAEEAPPAKAEEAEEPAQPEEKVSAPEEEPEPEPEPVKVVAPPKAKTKAPAKVISLPPEETQPEPEPEPEPAPEPEPKAEAEPEPEKQPEAKPEAEAKPEPPVEAVPETAKEKKVAKAATAPAPAKEKKAEKPAEKAGKAKPAKGDKKEKPVPVNRRKRQKDEPARIISKPTKPVAPTPAKRFDRGAPKPQRAPGRPMGNVPPPPDAGGDKDRARSRRKKGKRGSAMPTDDYLMRKTASRRREILDRADLYNGRRGKGKHRGSGGGKKARKTEITTPKAIKRRIKVGEAITVGELGKRMGIKAADLVGRLMKIGMMVTINQSLDVDDATLVAGELGFEVERTAFEEEGLLERTQDKPEELQSRPPVVTIMGHVDHGKTSLLDAIRATDVTATEAGGITQHIGAYDVQMESGGRVAFVDTPGHEAFTQMRARGAQVTDVVVLVVAADDGIMEQTREAINHSRAAKVPIIVAINKIDKPGADPERVKRELAEMELVPEDWGGDTITVEVSAKTGQGVEDLLEMLDLQSEILELSANPDKAARGTVLEARLDKGRGPVATVLVQEGTLKRGDPVVCGVHGGKVRAMMNDLGISLDKAGPSQPVEIQGLGGVPLAGDDFVVVESDKVAKQVAEHRAQKKREAELTAKTRLSLEGLLDQIKEGETKELPLVLKADVQGSVEALKESLAKLGNEQVKVSIIHTATGAITETDVMFASASDAIIIGFNVRPTGKVSDVAEAEGVEVRTYEVIYQVIEDVTAALTGMLAPNLVEEVIGRVDVRETFSVPKIGTVAGCYVTDGKVERNAKARLLRDGVVVTTAKISSLRRFKDDVKEVAQGFECGIGLENYNDIKIGDEIEVFVINEVAAKL